MGVRGTEFRVAYDGPVTQNSRIEVLEGLVRADNNSQNTGADLPLGKGAMLNPAVKEIKVIDLLKAPDLSATPSEILKPLALWPMPALEGAESYRVQIALDDRFNKIVRDLKVSTGSANLASLDNGNWFARVRGIDGQGLEGFDSVKLIAVKDGQWRVSYSSMSLVGGKTVLSWMGQQSSGQPMVASSYSALIARDEALTQTVVKAEAASSAPRMELGDLKPGVYFIRLSSNNGLASEIYRFEIPVNWGKSVFDQTSSLQAVK